MSNIYFTSDTHWNHANIIKYSKRPFADVNEMNEVLIDNWNSRIKPQDRVYHLGDVGFSNSQSNLCNILRRLNGQKFLIIGNHDEKTVDRDAKFRTYWETISDTKTVKYQGQSIFLSHYAHRVWNKSHRGSWHLYGHSHGSLSDDIRSNSFDVGVDCHNYFPLSFDDVARIMAKKQWEPIDHHGADTVE